jgi:hypothetical protein
MIEHLRPVLQEQPHKGRSMFEELFPRLPQAPYHDDGFHFVPGDAASDPDTSDLVSIHGDISNCAVGVFEERRVAIFENHTGDRHRCVFTRIAFDIGTHDFREASALGESWKIRREAHWVYFEAPQGSMPFTGFRDFLRDTNEILELYLL